jgi:hypothetical protein
VRFRKSHEWDEFRQAEDLAIHLLMRALGVSPKLESELLRDFVSAGLTDQHLQWAGTLLHVQRCREIREGAVVFRWRFPPGTQDVTGTMIV